jgi:hypothetical protein
MPRPEPPFWKQIFPGLFLATMYFVTYKVVHTVSETGIKGEHDFVPIIDESGKRIGFTHPTLVEATEKLREKELQKGQ